MPRPPVSKARPYTPQSGALAGQTFHTERSYRDALARLKGHKSWYDQQRQSKRVSGKHFSTMRLSETQARARALDALGRMRRNGESLKQAASEAHTTPNTVLKWASGAMDKTPSGRWTPKKTDRLYRRMIVISTDGVVELDIPSSREASLVGAHTNAVRRYCRRGDQTQLQRFRGKTVAGVEFETDPGELVGLWHIGELDFEDIYPENR
jgi:hypothetical protein